MGRDEERRWKEGDVREVRWVVCEGGRVMEEGEGTVRSVGYF